MGFKKFRKKATDISTAGITLGTGALITAKVQKGSGVVVTQGFSAAAGVFGVASTASLGGEVLSGVRKLKPKKSKKSKKTRRRR